MLFPMLMGSMLPPEPYCAPMDGVAVLAFCAGVAVTIIFVVILHHVCKGKP